MRVELSGLFRWWKRSRTGLIVARGEFRNGICLAGLDDLLNAAFRQQAQRTYYVGLIDLNGFTPFSPTQAFNPADTMASHPLWQESMAYQAATRPQWSPGASSGQLVTNGATFSFVTTASVTVHGFFIASDNTKGGTAGVLWATGAGAVDQQMSIGETLLGTYTLTAAAGVGS